MQPAHPMRADATAPSGRYSSVDAAVDDAFSSAPVSIASRPSRRFRTRRHAALRGTHQRVGDRAPGASS